MTFWSFYHLHIHYQHTPHNQSCALFAMWSSKTLLTRSFLGGGLSWQSCSKPSTKFPHGGLVECPTFHTHIWFFLRISRFSSFFHFFKIFGNPGPHRTYVLNDLLKLLPPPYSLSTYATQPILCTFRNVIEQNLVNSIIFGWWFIMAIVQ